MVYSLRTDLGEVATRPQAVGHRVDDGAEHAVRAVEARCPAGERTGRQLHLERLAPRQGVAADEGVAGAGVAEAVVREMPYHVEGVAVDGDRLHTAVGLVDRP